VGFDFDFFGDEKKLALGMMTRVVVAVLPVEGCLCT